MKTKLALAPYLLPLAYLIVGAIALGGLVFIVARTLIYWGIEWVLKQ